MARHAHGAVTVAGPSHARRFRAAIATGQIPKTRRTIRWRELGAASMLHPYFSEAEFSSRPETALIFVPDFRLGNRSLVSPDEVDAYTRVDKTLIRRSNDVEMRDRVLARVVEIRDANPEARFVFWCLGWRELNNRTLGNHFENGVYRHPVWNLAEVEGVVGDAVVSLLPMLEHPLGRTLHIDGSGHPSFVGLELFRRMTDDPVSDAGAHLDAMKEYLARPLVALPRDVILTGDSVWLKALHLYVERGLIRLHPDLEWRTVEELLVEPPSERRRVVHVSGQRIAESSAGSEILAEEPADLIALTRKGYKVTTFLWEARASEVLHPALRRARNHPRSLASLCRAVGAAVPAASVIAEASHSPSLVRPTDVEVSHPEGPWPTLHGLLGVVRAVGGMHRLEPFV